MKTYSFILLCLGMVPMALAQTIYPPAGQSSFILSSGQSETVSDPQSIILTPTVWIQSGATFAAMIEAPNTADDPYATPAFGAYNYVFTRVHQTPKTSFDPNMALEGDVQESINYLDGLGRPLQQTLIKASPNLKDLVTPMVYDPFGRMAKEYLPYEDQGTPGDFHTNAIDATKTYYVNAYGSDLSATEANPFSLKELEAYPRNRVLKQAAPGEDWKLGNTHEIKYAYSTNTSDEVRLFEVNTTFSNNTYLPNLVDNTVYYNPNELYKTVTKDENWQTGQIYSTDHTMEEFVDKRGRTILKRTYNAGVVHDTYYVYDEFDNLTYVLSPKVDLSNEVSTQELNGLSYQYIYDHRNRLVEKKLPGKDWEEIVYDKLDRPIMTRDGNLKGNNQWLFTKYDAFGRVAYTGRYDTSDDRITIQAVVDATTVHYEAKTGTPTNYTPDNTAVYYTSNAYPTSFDKVFTINYYDNYTFDLDGIVLQSGTLFTQPIANDVQGLPTGNKVRVLDPSAGSGQADWITTVMQYDEKGRGIFSHTKNPYLNTEQLLKQELDFVGRVVQSETTQKRAGDSDIITRDTYTYDHQGRLLQHEQELGGQTELITQNSYDAIGLLEQKKVGNSFASPLQTVDYDYNIRGWLTGINDVSTLNNDLFAFKIAYARPEDGITTALYNGNIAETHWKTANDESTSSPKYYRYNYDALNRIKGAAGRNFDDALYLGRGYSASYSYDKNGNIITLNRTKDNYYRYIDVLSYSYSGNQLSYVTDAASDGGYSDVQSTEGFYDGNTVSIDFFYDPNGNLIRDDNKGIDPITYNHLNLPTTIVINTPQHNGTISYIYDATGIKLQKTVGSTSTQYAGNYIYQNGNLQFFSHPEGYTTPDGSGGYEYVYQYKDHLGNVRLSYADADGNGSIDPANEIIEESNYYPFGLKHKGYNEVVSPYGNSVAQQWKYNGTEFEEALDLNLCEMDFRQYDAALGRFNAIDRLSEFAVAITPYRFAFNNPVSFSDPTGLYEVDENGNYIITDANEIKAFRSILANNQHASVADLVYEIIVSEELVEELPGITVTSSGDSYLTEGANQIASQAQNSLDRISSKKREWNIDLYGDGKNVLHQETGVRGFGISVEFASPTKIPNTNLNGFGIDVGLLSDENGVAPYMTLKGTEEPGVAFGGQLEFFQALKTSSNPKDFLTRRNLRGSGYEASFGAGPVGGSWSTSDATRYNRTSSYGMLSTSIGLGIDLGYVNWLTNTYIPTPQNNKK